MRQRLHLVIHLPNDDPAEATAYASILVHLGHHVFPGEGYSLLKRVEGYWMSLDGTKFIKDYSTLYVTDIPLPETTEALTELIYGIRSYALMSYSIAGRPQEEIWITSHAITQHGASV